MVSLGPAARLIQNSDTTHMDEPPSRRVMPKNGHNHSIWPCVRMCFAGLPARHRKHGPEEILPADFKAVLPSGRRLISLTADKTALATPAVGQKLFSIHHLHLVCICLQDALNMPTNMPSSKSNTGAAELLRQYTKCQVDKASTQVQLDLQTN